LRYQHGHNSILYSTTSSWNDHITTQRRNGTSRTQMLHLPESLTLKVVGAKRGPTPIVNKKRQTAPHRESRRPVGPYAVVPLQHHPPIDRVKSPDPDYSSTRGGLATYVVGLRSLRNTACGALPHPPQHSKSRICLLCCHQNGGQSRPASLCGRTA
jgi:hypothetical protein